MRRRPCCGSCPRNSALRSEPEHIIITPANEVKILDFGLAKTLPHSELSDDSSPTTSKSTSISGTPAYMSPEILMEQVPDQRSDIFSMGVVFYEVLTGINPFRADTFVGTTDRILRETPPPIRDAGVPTVSPALGTNRLQDDCQAARRPLCVRKVTAPHSQCDSA